MNWRPYPDIRPTESQPYLVSVNRKYGSGDLTFNYIAHYNADTDTWHKYNGFDDDSVKEPITDRVTGWIGNLSVMI